MRTSLWVVGAVTVLICAGCGPVDESEDDAGTSKLDGGSVKTDAGTTHQDAGRVDAGAGVDAGQPMMTVDASVPFDAGQPVVDAGQPGVDAGQPVVDAGQPVVDAGPSVDAGQPVVDAGPSVDAGQPVVDAGQPAVDAGQPDAGQPVVDAGQPDAGQPDAGQADAGQPVVDAGVQIFNNCTEGSFLDRTGTTTTQVDFGGFGMSSGFTYSPKCIVVLVGHQVTFSGAFSSHPLAPGTFSNHSAGTSGSPIMPTNSTMSATFTFNGVGEFPYYCTAHGGGGMNGVVRVRTQ